MRWSSLLALAPIALGLALGFAAPPMPAPALAGRATLTPFVTTTPVPANTPRPYPAPRLAAETSPTLAVTRDGPRLVVTWTAPGCVWLVGGPGADVPIDGGCGASGSVTLGGGGDAAYQPAQHAALEWRPWGDGAPVRVAVPAYRVWLPVAAGR